MPLLCVPILIVSSYLSNLINELNASVSKNRVFYLQQIYFRDHDYAYVPDPTNLSLCSQIIIVYIAGFVIFKLEKLLCC